jgi:uncharacterized protein (UPF0548 family)
VLFLRRPDERTLERVLDEEQEQPLTYREIGNAPRGFRRDEYRRALGAGDAVFARAGEGLRRWEPHRHAGVALTPACPELRAGTTVLVRLRAGPVHVVGGCRILHVIDERDRFGFVYATLPTHPEVGEERFVVERDGESVTFHVLALSRWRDPVVRAAAPVARLVQRRITTRYLDGLEGFVRSGWS